MDSLSRLVVSPAILCAFLIAPADQVAAQRGAPSERRASPLGFEQFQKLRALELPRPSPGSLPRLDGERPVILVTGYWPPSNEMLRHLNPDETQNPGEWGGDNWEGRGYDVHAFFPEFEPPNCSFCGKGFGILEVDYQDTSNDFWPIADGLDPIAVVTFSRGTGALDWEVEMNQYNRTTWINDYVAPLMPTPNPPDATYPAGGLRLSMLPLQEIVDAVNAASLGLNAFICFSQAGGGFLSEFIVYHGVWYQDIHRSPARADWCIAAGHVHVGTQISWPTARAAAEVTIREVIAHVDAVLANTVCQQDLGFGGPGGSSLVLCGAALATGGAADLLLSGATSNANAVVILGDNMNPVGVLGGTLVPSAPLAAIPFVTDASGEIVIEDLPGGGGPGTIFAQALYVDPSIPPFNLGFSNAIRIEVLP